MEKAELLSTFSGHLDAYEELRSFIDKAQAQIGKFSATTIEKVVMKNEIKSSDIADELRPLVADIEGVIAGLSADIEAVNERKASADEEMEELQLRQVIGELTDDEFEAASSDFKSELDEAEARLADLTGEREDFGAALDRWVTLATKAEHDTGVTPVVDEDTADEDSGEAIEAEEEIEVEIGEEEVSVPRIREDLSAVIAATEAEGAAVRVMPPEEEEISIEAAEADEADDESVDVDFGFGAEGEEIDILGDEGDEVEIDLVGDVDEDEDEAEVEVDVGDDDDEVPGEEAADAGDDAAKRRALLIYQEGTAEEQIYPFTNDVLTIGRGRDNDIQIKNDSKVSRYHCKVYRRGDHFYIEDNKSSNGSLVNGELITERRLFGGEEVIIGETFFRFRIME